MLNYAPAAPGGWLTVVSAGSVVAVDARARRVPPATELLEALEAADGVGSVVGLLATDGLASTPPFVLVLARDDARLHCVLRGPAALEVRAAGTARTVSAAGVATWLEQTFEDVESFRLVLDAAAPSVDPLPVERGSAWAGAVIAGAETPEADADPAAAARDGADESGPEDSAPGAAGPVPEAAGHTSDASEPEGVAEETVFREAAVVTEAPSTEPSPAVPVDDGDDAASDDAAVSPSVAQTRVGWEETVVPPIGDGAGPDAAAEPGAPAVDEKTVWRGQAAPEHEPAADPAPRSQIRIPSSIADSVPRADDRAGDHDGMTVMSSDVQELRRSATPPPAAVPTTPAEAPRPVFELETAAGARERLDHPLVVGRAPSVSKVSGTEVPRLLTVDSKDQDISRNHVRFAVEGDAVVVTDLHSRNGTTIALPGKAPQKLRQGEPTTVLGGTVVDLGGGVTFTVCEAGG